MLSKMKFFGVVTVLLISITPARADLKTDAEAAYSNAKNAWNAYEAHHTATDTARNAVIGGYFEVMAGYSNWTLVKQGYVDTYYTTPALTEIDDITNLMELIEDVIMEQYQLPAFANMELAKEVADFSDDPNIVAEMYEYMIYFSGQAIYYTEWADTNLDNVVSGVATLLHYIEMIETA